MTGSEMVIEADRMASNHAMGSIHGSPGSIHGSPAPWTPWAPYPAGEEIARIHQSRDDAALADDRTNPKDRVGATKVDMSLIPPVALAHCAHAMMDGARKYGPFNFRDKAPRARTYIAAAMRHLASYLDGEDAAADSGAHHLGHAMACCAILLDAIELDRVVDDRPAKGAASDVLARLNATIAARAA